jgi:outer membrane protein TolC
MCKTSRVSSSRWLLAFFAASLVLQPWLSPLTPAHAASARTEAGVATTLLPISLVQSVMLALQNSMDLKVERLSPLIREEEVRREAGAFFSPRIGFEASTDRALRVAGSVLAGAQVLETENLDLNTGISMRSNTGGLVSLDFRNKRFETNSVFQLYDPQYTAELALTLTHPLLKNFGIGINRVRIKVAENNMEMSKYQLRVLVMNLVVDVQQTYWELVMAANDSVTRRHSLEVAQHLQRRTAEMISQGRLPAIALLQAKTAVLEREIDLGTAENASADAEARLKSLLNLNRVMGSATYTLVPTDPPHIEPHMVSIEEGVKSALAKRPELVQARLDQDNRMLGERFARNQQMPEVNFVGSIGLSGLSGSPTPNLFNTTSIGGTPITTVLPDRPETSTYAGGYGAALGRLVTGDFMSYKVGVSVQIPLGNQMARSEVAKSKLEVEKAKLFIQSLEQKIALEVERVARGLTNSARALEGARALRDLAERKLAMAQEGLELGVASVTDVIEAQKNLSLSQRDELRAVIEYRKTTVLWERSIGSVLEHFPIEL